LAALTALDGPIVITAVVEVVPAPVSAMLDALATPATVLGLLPVVGTVKLIFVADEVPIVNNPELPIRETSNFLVPHPIPLVAFVETLFKPDKVIVVTLKKLSPVLHSSAISVVIPSESQATACLAPCPNSKGEDDPSVIDAAKVVPKYVTAIKVTNPAKILVRLRAPRPPNRVPIRPLSGELFAITNYSSCMRKG
jgi:hypothetical protein